MIQNLLKGKSIIIAIPNDFGLPGMFKENLEFLGMKVYALDHSQNHQSISLSDKIKHIQRKIFNSDRTYKSIARENNRLKTEKGLHLNFLNALEEKTDYALILRPDLLNDEVIQKIKHSTKKLVGYQWDGLKRYPGIYKKLDFFESFFVFDPEDLAFNANFKLMTNFYFDYDLKVNENPGKDVFFIGSHIEGRMPLLMEISSFLKKAGFKIDINVMGSSKKYAEAHSETGIKFIKEIFDFKKNYKRIENSASILDLLNDVHIGLSLRTFEAIGFRKKLITNNIQVTNYDFYNKNNIFVLGERPLEELKSFLSTPYENLDRDINTKYSFTNWLANILNLPGHNPIIK